MYAVLTYRYSPTSSEVETGIPLDWPMELIEINDISEKPSSDWIVFDTIEDYNTYIESKKSLYDIWENFKDLNKLKEIKKTEINNQRDIILNQTLFFMDNEWDIDDKSKQNITGAITFILAGITLPPDFAWRNHDNINVPMNAPSLIQLGGYFMIYINSVYASSWAKKAEIDNISTLEDLENYNILSNWPSNNFNS